MQTGKRNPLPLILFDEPGDNYWLKWIRFVKKELLAKGYISESDLKLFEIVDAVDDAVERINRFYRRYHSLRNVGNQLSIRLQSKINGSALKELNVNFSDILTPNGGIFLSGPLPEEVDEPDISNLPRLVGDFNRIDYGRLKDLIDDLNR